MGRRRIDRIKWPDARHPRTERRNVAPRTEAQTGLTCQFWYPGLRRFLRRIPNPSGTDEMVGPTE